MIKIKNIKKNRLSIFLTPLFTLTMVSAHAVQPPPPPPPPPIYVPGSSESPETSDNSAISERPTTSRAANSYQTQPRLVGDIGSILGDARHTHPMLDNVDNVDNVDNGGVSSQSSSKTATPSNPVKVTKERLEKRFSEQSIANGLSAKTEPQAQNAPQHKKKPSEGFLRKKAIIEQHLGGSSTVPRPRTSALRPSLTLRINDDISTPSTARSGRLINNDALSNPLPHHVPHATSERPASNDAILPFHTPHHAPEQPGSDDAILPFHAPHHAPEQSGSDDAILPFHSSHDAPEQPGSDEAILPRHEPLMAPTTGADDHPPANGRETVADDGNNHPVAKPDMVQHTVPYVQPKSALTSPLVLHPVTASYIANLNAANTLFITTMNDRTGKAQYTDALTGEKKISSLWLRQTGRHSRWRDTHDQLATQSNSYVTQLGGDVLQWGSDGFSHGHIGLMAGYGKSHNKTTSSMSPDSSKGSIHGYSVGGYGTWFANDTDKSGLYVDSWLQYGWFTNHVDGQNLSKSQYKSKGFTASIETGYTLKIREFTKKQEGLKQWFIQPQAQVTWMGVKANAHRDTNNMQISKGKDNIQTRLGVRTYLKGQHAMDRSKHREFEPFVEINWIHNTHDFSATFNDAQATQAGSRNTAEVKVGIAGNINAKVSLWGHIGTQAGNKGYSNNTLNLGIKYNF